MRAIEPLECNQPPYDAHERILNNAVALRVGRWIALALGINRGCYPFYNEFPNVLRQLVDVIAVFRVRRIWHLVLSFTDPPHIVVLPQPPGLVEPMT